MFCLCSVWYHPSLQEIKMWNQSQCEQGLLSTLDSLSGHHLKYFHLLRLLQMAPTPDHRLCNGRNFFQCYNFFQCFPRQELFPMLQLFPMLSKAGTFSNATTFSNAFQGRNFFQCYNFFQCFPRQELFPMLHTSMVSEGGREFENFSKKGIFVVSSGKKQISLLLAPPRKTFRKIHQWLSCKTPFDAHAHNKHVKLHHFRKIFCCITPSGNTVQQHQCAKQAISGGQTVHGVFCQRITKSCQITNNNWQNTAKILLFFH